MTAANLAAAGSATLGTVAALTLLVALPARAHDGDLAAPFGPVERLRLIAVAAPGVSKSTGQGVMFWFRFEPKTGQQGEWVKYHESPIPNGPPPVLLYRNRALQVDPSWRMMLFYKNGSTRRW